LSQIDRDYAMKNIIKGVGLAAIALPGTAALVNALVTNQWDSRLFSVLGVMYVQFDLAGCTLLGGTRRMALTTIAHHSVVLALGVANIMTKYEEPTLMRCAIATAVTSCLSFGANLYVGFRRAMTIIHLNASFDHIEEQLRPVARFATVSYFVSLLIGNSLVIYLLLQSDAPAVPNKLIYSLLHSVILIDDLVFLRFLSKTI
jgi:hypothetical protein